MDAGSAPERVGQAHLADQPPDLGRHARSTETSPRLPAPEGAKASAMPAQNRLRPNNRHCIENGRHEPVQPYKDEAIKHAEGRALGCAPTQHIQPLAKDDDLRLEGSSRPERVEQHPLDQIQELEHSIIIVDSHRRPKRTEFAIRTGSSSRKSILRARVRIAPLPHLAPWT